MSTKPPESQPSESLSNDQQAINCVVDTTMIGAESELDRRFVEMLAKHIENENIETVQEVCKLLEEFSRACVDQDEKFPHLFSGSAVFTRAAVDKVLTSSTSAGQ